MKSRLAVLTVFLLSITTTAAFAAPEYVTSSPLDFSDSGFAGWSVPAGRVITGGGFQLSASTAAVSVPGIPNAVWPHYTFGPDEYGWVVQPTADGVPSPGSFIYAIHDEEPPGYEIITSVELSFGDGGWGGWSAPPGKVVLGGGFEATGPVAVSAPATPNTSWPHYNYGPDEYGWVVQDAQDGQPNTITIWVICADEPAGYEVVKSGALNYGDGGWAGWSAPAGKKVTGGGFQLAANGGGAAASAPATPGSVWPHYTFGADEYGWVVQEAPNGAGSNGSHVYAICVNAVDDNVSAIGPIDCITPDNTCETVTVTFDREDTTPVRGVSVTLQLSSELTLCDTDPLNLLDNFQVLFGAGDFWNGYGNLQTNIYDNGGGSYTVDMALLGAPCGPVDGGDLFTIDVAADAGLVGDAIGTVTITDLVVRDCANTPLPAMPGTAADVIIDQTAPDAVIDLVAAQVKTGNDSDGTTKIELSWTSPGGEAELIEIWRKGYGFYPEYDDAGGTEPTAPVTLANGWELVTTVDIDDLTYPDETTTRDFWYYAAYAVDGCGTRSAVSAITDGTLNYHLGDVAPGDGNNAVGTGDVSLLGSAYGIDDTDPNYLNTLDFGPTTDLSVDARPTTDNRIDFEDLIVLAVNYGGVGKENLPTLTPAAMSAVTAKIGEVDEATGTFAVEIAMSADGRIQGLSVPLSWNADVVEPVGYAPGDLIARQGGLGMVLSPEPGTVDAAIFGDRDLGISGTGTLATVTFRKVGAGEPAIAVGEIVARDGENNPVVVSGASAQPAIPSVARTELLPNSPNPFNPSTKLSFALANPGNVSLKIYSVQGRLVATLVSGDMAAGQHDVMWYGRDDTGRAVSSGTYLVRLEASGVVQSRRIMLMK